MAWSFPEIRPSLIAARLRQKFAPFAFPLAAALASRVWLTLLGVAIWLLPIPWELVQRAYYGLTPLRAGLLGALLGIWQRWDAIHYQRVALYGYRDENLSAFYPLYPLTTRLLARISPLDELAALSLISFAALIASVLLLWQIARSLCEEDTAKWAAAFLLTAPAAFFLFAPYAESLQLALGLGAYNAALKRRWLLCLILGVLAGLTQPTAVFLIVALLVEALGRERRSPWLRRGAAAVASLGPGMGVALFLAYRAGQGFPSYQSVQYLGWGWEIQWPWQMFLGLPNLTQYFSLLGATWVNVGVALAVIGVTLWGWRRLPLSLALFQGALILFLLCSARQSEPFASWGRHALFLFPTYLILAQSVTAPQLRLRLLTVSLGVQTLLAAQYFAWLWVG